MFKIKNRIGRFSRMSKRIVGAVELERLRQEIHRYAEVMQRCETAVRCIQDRVDGLHSDGKDEEAARLLMSTVGAILPAAEGATARFESAAVAFLGESRGKHENVAAYVRRIGLALSDGNAAIAMQRRNGIRVDLTGFAARPPHQALSTSGAPAIDHKEH